MPQISVLIFETEYAFYYAYTLRWTGSLTGRADESESEPR
jgi:hypothetical protein